MALNFTLEDAYAAASAWVFNAMSVTEWEMTEIKEGTPIESPTANAGVYQLQKMNIEDETAVTDRVIMEWAIMGRWANNAALNREVIKSTKAHFLHSALSSGSTGIYLPQVTEVDFTDLFNDDFITLTITCTCMASIDR